jgi:hypothetical protein
MGPGKDPLRIRCEQPLRVEITPIGDEAIRIGVVWVWKDKGIEEAMSRHSHGPRRRRNAYYPGLIRSDGLALCCDQSQYYKL